MRNVAPYGRRSRQRHAVHDRAHGVLANAEVEVACAVIVLLEITFAVDQRLGRGIQIGRATHQVRNVLRHRVQHLRVRLARGQSLRIRRERRNIFVPTLRQLAVEHLLPHLRQLGIVLRPRLVLIVPLALPLRAAFDGLAHVLLHFVGDQELRIGRPAVRFLRQPYLIRAQGFAVRFLGVLPVGRAPADMRVDDDQRGTRHFALRRPDGHVDQLQVVHVGDVQHVPVPAAEARGHVVAEGQRGAALDGDVIVVVEPDQVRQAEMSRDRRCFVADAFHQVAIAAEDVGAIVEGIAAVLAELGGQPALRHGEANRVRNALPQRAGGGLDAWRQAVLRMAGRLRVPLAELLQAHRARDRSR